MKPTRKPPALKTPAVGDEQALTDLRALRKQLLTISRRPKISARDFAAISAELRKVNASISVVEGAKKQTGGVDEETIAKRADAIRTKLERIREERNRRQSGETIAEPLTDEDEPTAATG